MAEVLGEAERWAVFTVHDKKCYIDSEPLTYSTLEVDHVIPETLIDDPLRLAEVLTQLGRPAAFEVNSFENWLPACRLHNGKKSARPWDASLLVQQALQRAADRADEARTVATRFKKRASAGKAIATLKSLREDGVLSDEDKVELRTLVADFASDQAPDLEPQSVPLTPDFAVPLHQALSDDGVTMVVRGPFGTGRGPSDRVGHTISEAMRCGSCGLPWFNGARCVTCGAMDDGD